MMGSHKLSPDYLLIPEAFPKNVEQPAWKFKNQSKSNVSPSPVAALQHL